MSIRIAFDLDDTIMEFAEYFWKWHQKIYNWRIQTNKLYTYNWIKIAKENGYKLTREIIEHKITEFIHSDMHQTTPTLPLALKYLKKLKATGLKIYIITARAYKENSKPTIDWVNTYLGNIITDIIFTRKTTKETHILQPNSKIIAKSKAEISKQLNIVAYTDDAIHNLVDFKNTNIYTMAIFRPWTKNDINQLPIEQKTHIHIAKSWKNIYNNIIQTISTY